MVDESILREAQRLVHGPRQGAYGHPFDDFTRTGQMWGPILGLDGPVPPDKVALCLVAVKISREVNAPKRDNRVDIAGYAEALDLVRQRQSPVTASCGHRSDGLPGRAEVCCLGENHAGPHAWAELA